MKNFGLALSLYLMILFMILACILFVPWEEPIIERLNYKEKQRVIEIIKEYQLQTKCECVNEQTN